MPQPSMPVPTSLADCQALDVRDALAPVRERFVLPEGVVNLDGNSLGSLPRAAAGRIGRAVEQEWGRDLIRSWNAAGWFSLPERLGDRIGTLIGAAPGQTLCCSETSINLHKCLHAALSLRPGRNVIVAEASSFPTDLYIIEGVMAAAGRPLERRLIGPDRNLDAVLDERVAVVVVSEIDYRTAAVVDLVEATRKTQAAGALMLADLCHSAGIKPIALDAWKVDFAVGCTYKYLNGGPGAPAFLYAARRHHEAATQPLTGWWSHARPFAFETDYAPQSGIKKFLTGTQPVLSMLGVEAGLDAFAGVDLEVVRAKSIAQTSLFIDRIDVLLGNAIDVRSPRDHASRGGHVALGHPEGYAVVQAMIAEGLIGDFRAPDTLRFAFSPLYTSYAEVWQAAEALARCVRQQVWKEERFRQRAAVT